MLSFNKNDLNSIWNYNNWQGSCLDWFLTTNALIEQYVVFAEDEFGNLVCFNKESNKIVFIDHEEADFSVAVQDIANSFSEFINNRSE